MSEETPDGAAPQVAGTTQASRAVHGGEARTRPHHALAEPIVQTATYTFDDTADLVRYMEGHGARGREEYGRYGNPTVRTFEEKIAALEGTADAVAFASGMAAVTTTILALTKAGSHVVLFSDCYRRTRQFVTGFLDRFGVRSTLVPPADLDALEAAITKDTRLVVSEAPTVSRTSTRVASSFAESRRPRTSCKSSRHAPTSVPRSCARRSKTEEAAEGSRRRSTWIRASSASASAGAEADASPSSMSLTTASQRPTRSR